MYHIIYGQPNICGVGLPCKDKPLERWNIVLGVFKLLVLSIWKAFYKWKVFK